VLEGDFTRHEEAFDMDLARVGRVCVALGLAATLGVGAVSAGLARPKPPVVEPPQETPMPQVGLASRFLTEAAAYDSYLRQASAISPAFGGPAQVASSLRTGVAYEPGELRRGAVAYAAIAALSDSAFVADVRRAGATAQGRYAIVAKIFANPASVLSFADAPRAAGLAKQALIGSGSRLYDDGKAVKQAAYDIQHQSWSLADVADRDSRLATVKSLSSSRREISEEDTATLSRVMGGASAQMSDAASAPFSPLTVRAVALAALAAIGQAGDDNVERLGWLTDDYFMDHCLSEAKLALYECLAVAKPNYEDVFCLGQHAMKDTGACIVQSSYGAVPIEIATRPLRVPPAHVRHVVARRRRR
jgi:hypothetical protein